jgi:hypothetical protein
LFELLPLKSECLSGALHINVVTSLQTFLAVVKKVCTKVLALFVLSLYSDKKGEKSWIALKTRKCDKKTYK